jgi:hypothetical protein
MWLLPFLTKQNLAKMKAEGCKLSAKDIYDVNNSSLKDAIVQFGGGCTGELVSPKGLLLTNHHCGYDAIRSHSTVEHDYLKNGFWAMSMEEEIPTPGLTVRVMKEIVDVTAEVTAGVTEEMDEIKREELIKKNIDSYLANYNNPKGYDVQIKEFLGGNQYLLLISEIFKDVRLVGAPPSSIGKFGGETDNWMWPRHTGDFSVFRVYTAPDGSPAEYSKDNVPYVPKNYLKVSLKGYKPGDFAMIIGFPGRTNRYMSSYEIDHVINQENPNRIYIRGERQKLMMEDMVSSDAIRIQYSSKYARSSNYWKNSIGMVRGLKNLKVADKKRAQEATFEEWVNQIPDRQALYGEALKMKREYVEKTAPYQNVSQQLTEALATSVEILGFSQQAMSMLKKGVDVKDIKAKFAELYKDYNLSTDRKIAKRMFQIIKERLAENELPTAYKEVIANYENIDAFVEAMYSSTILNSYESLCEALDKNAESKDALMAQLSEEIVGKTSTSVWISIINNNNPIKELADEKHRAHRLFIKGWIEMNPNKLPYPDANLTMRITYGQVLPYSPRDGVDYHYYTTLKGVMEKENPENPVEFTVEPRLKELYQNKDYGRYGVKGEMPVAFLSNNDITGGNSGSPVINGKGELIGIAFDGNWEAMSGDVAFEPELQRTISVDIRYVLFVIDKFAGAGHLVDEMTLVEK